MTGPLSIAAAFLIFTWNGALMHSNYEAGVALHKERQRADAFLSQLRRYRQTEQLRQQGVIDEPPPGRWSPNSGT